MSLPLTDLHCQTFPLDLCPTELDWIYSQFSLAVPRASARGGRNQPESILHLTHLFANVHPTSFAMQHSNERFDEITWSHGKELHSKFDKLYFGGVRAMRNNVGAIFDAHYRNSVSPANTTQKSFVDQFEKWVGKIPARRTFPLGNKVLVAYDATRRGWEGVPYRVKLWLKSLFETPQFLLLLAFVEFEMSCPRQRDVVHGVEGSDNWWIISETRGVQTLKFRSGELRQLITVCRDKSTAFFERWANYADSDMSLMLQPIISSEDVQDFLEGVGQQNVPQRPATCPCGSQISNPASFGSSGASEVQTARTLPATMASIGNESTFGTSTAILSDHSMSAAISTLPLAARPNTSTLY